MKEKKYTLIISPIIPPLRRLRQEDCLEFEVSLGYIVRPCLGRKEGRKERKKGRKGGRKEGGAVPESTPSTHTGKPPVSFHHHTEEGWCSGKS